MSIVQELQREAREKTRVLQHSVQALTDVLSDREPSLTQPEQVPFMYENDNATRHNLHCRGVCNFLTIFSPLYMRVFPPFLFG